LTARRTAFDPCLLFLMVCFEGRLGAMIKDW